VDRTDPCSPLCLDPPWPRPDPPPPRLDPPRHASIPPRRRWTGQIHARRCASIRHGHALIHHRRASILRVGAIGEGLAREEREHPPVRERERALRERPPVRERETEEKVVLGRRGERAVVCGCG